MSLHSLAGVLSRRAMECGDLSPLWEFRIVRLSYDPPFHKPSGGHVHATILRSQTPKAVTSPRTPDPNSGLVIVTSLGGSRFIPGRCPPAFLYYPHRIRCRDGGP